ncbi:influenza virus NS1A-binding protein homolog [Nasonia vitripennis]|uniref:Kelch-like protein diablo n=1 Tax=Nasonia vitripennis TaxID=7425 RepID=A0A7M7LU03_NASVI|nr:influenza virus NS1A-binding protein homolog [Nasonia vitripennis]XP_003424732.1 influenza virus NS1A-binding protein homolog [Nasonia vitripennis]XP_008203898.1 influenza virus NS1A-binding protein homolog [Nasonia vitripennis]XP_031788675.1 influenza virus NS1A-binding protein homolog [Nasonia vitripennis]XP_031788676.1 influenza virus NS1A-binding protein homolog [Nasonia vitripennis]XP_031788677.1 influenza virus NS1A-binding protein homolog [Nasonia vitripennis]
MVSSISTNGDAEGLKSSTLELQDEHHSRLILSSLNMMRKNKHFCDVILHAGNAEVHGHRAVLAAASPYLFDLFSTENQGNKEPVITYKLSDNIDKKALQKLMDYAYTSRLEIRPAEVKSVYLAASYLKMERIASQCAAHLLESLTPESCLDIRSLPGITQNETFVKQVDAYIRQNFEAVCASPALSFLPSVKIEVLYQTSQEMSLVNGSSLCCLVLDWIKRFLADQDNSSVEQLIEKTYLLYLALDNSLQDCTDLPSGDVSDTDIVQDYKKLSLKTQAQNKNRRKGVLQPAKPRVLIYNRNIEDSIEEQLEPDWNMIGVNKVGEHTFLAIVTLNGRLAKLSVLLRLNAPSSPAAQDNISRIPDDQRSSSSEPDLYCALPTMKAGKCSVGCAELNGALLVCGGYDRVECLKTVDKYIPESNTWEVLSAMREARGRFGIAVVNGKVYAIGGSNGSTELATVEVLDPESGKWKAIASLPLARSNSGVCALGEKIYCIGGWNGQAGIKQCDIFDPSTGDWSSIESLKIGRYQAGVCAYDNKVYAVGGCDSWNCLNSVEIYDPTTNSWSMGPALITARRGCGLAVFHGRLYAVGGSTGTHSLTSTEVYDPSEQVWVPGPSMCTPRANVAVAVVGDRLYAVGGFSGKNFLNSIEYLDVHTNEWTTFIPKTDGIKTPPNPEYSNYSDSSANGSEKDMPQSTAGSRQLSKANSEVE